jgi:PadR family transcriptional regulator PadR
MSDDVLRHLFLGFIRLHVLYHAAKEPICGAELIEELEHHGYEVGPGTFYPMLHQLQKAGLLTSEDETVGGKRRKNLRTTPAGKKLLVNAKEQLKELSEELLEDRDGRELRGKK